MNPNLNINTYCEEVELSDGDLMDMLADVKIEWSKDGTRYYRGDYMVTARLKPVGGNQEIEVDITHLVKESTIDEILENGILS